MAHIVKCLICGKQFDAQPEDKDIKWYKPNTRRYAHIECQKEGKELVAEDKEFDELYRYVKEQQGKNFNFVQFQKIVDKWKKDYGYTYSGMLKSLLYFYEVKKNSKDKFKAGSLGIIPFCYTQAYNYYYDIYLANQNAGTGEYQQKNRTISIPAPERKVPKIRLFDLDMEVDDEE